MRGLRRARLLPQDTLLRLPDGRAVLYARLHYFAHDTTQQLAAAVAATEADGGPVAGYILDLRNDPGGVFEEAVAIASLFHVSWAAGLACCARGCVHVRVVV